MTYSNCYFSNPDSETFLIDNKQVSKKEFEKRLLDAINEWKIEGEK